MQMPAVADVLYARTARDIAGVLPTCDSRHCFASNTSLSTRLSRTNGWQGTSRWIQTRPRGKGDVQAPASIQLGFGSIAVQSFACYRRVLFQILEDNRDKMHPVWYISGWTKVRCPWPGQRWRQVHLKACTSLTVCMVICHA